MRRLVMIAVFSALALATPCSAVDISSCGVTVGPGETAPLVADLDCSTAGGRCIYPILGAGDVSCTSDDDCAALPESLRYCAREAVRLSSGATLEMNGHVLTGAGIACLGPGRCRINGPGEVVGAAAGVLGVGGRVFLTGVTVRDGEYGVFVRRGTLVLSNAQALNNETVGIVNVLSSIRVEGAVSSDNGFEGYSGKNITGQNLTALGNGGHGVFMFNRVKVRGITVQGNDASGVFAARITLQDGDVTGNGPGQTSDLYTQRRIVLKNVTCGYSNFPGVCANN
jgi:hypothetical protein